MSDEEMRALANILSGEINVAVLLLHSVDGKRTLTHCAVCGSKHNDNHLKLSHAHKAGCRIDIAARQVRKLRHQLGLKGNQGNL